MFKRLIHLSLTTFVLATACAPEQSPLQNLPGNAAFLAQNNTARVKQAKQVVQFNWRQPQELHELSHRLDLFGIEPEKQTAKALVSQAEFALLQTRGLRPTPVMEAHMERGGLPSGYMTYAQLVPRLQQYAQQFPQLVSLADVGDTWQKQQGQSPSHDIWAITLGNRQRQGKAAILMTGGIHARELAPVELLMKLMDNLLTQYGKDAQITQLLDTHEIVILPMVNVDGRVAVEKGDTWQRKNMHGEGIDLNRNFDHHWNYQGLNVPNSWKDGLSEPSGETYSGSSPASEPETQAVQNMYQGRKYKLFIDMHAYGELMLWPFGYSEKDIPEAGIYRQAWTQTFKQIGFKGGNSIQLLYPTTGTSRDYGHGRHGAFSVTLEVGKSFRPSFAEVEQMWTRMRPHLLTTLHTAGLSATGNTR